MLITYAGTVIGLVVLGFCLTKWSDIRYSALHTFAGFLGISSYLFCFISLVGGLVFSYGWYSSGHKAKIINREYKTNYTQEEIFYAEDVIETIREIKRQRNEVKVEVK